MTLTRTHLFVVRLTARESARVTRAATRQGMAKSVWVRQLIRRGLLEEDTKLAKAKERNAQQQQSERTNESESSPAA